MSFIGFCKDFTVGLTRGLSVFFNERNDFAERAYVPGVFPGRGSFQNR